MVWVQLTLAVMPMVEARCALRRRTPTREVGSRSGTLSALVPWGRRLTNPGQCHPRSLAADNQLQIRLTSSGQSNHAF
jgi:hypothetical protein